MNQKTLAAAFPVTVPVLMGYLAIGMAFGLMLQSIGYGVGWASPCWRRGPPWRRRPS